MSTTTTPVSLATPLRPCASPTCARFIRWGIHTYDGSELAPANRLRLCFDCAAKARSKRRALALANGLRVESVAKD